MFYPSKFAAYFPPPAGYAIFVGNEQKVFVIQVEHNMGAIIGMFLKDTPKERPLTHDLMNNIFKGFNITIQRVIITELKNATLLRAPLRFADGKRTRQKNQSRSMPAPVIASLWPPPKEKPIFVSTPLALRTSR